MKTTIIFFLYSTIWLVFTQGSDTSWIIGLPVIIAAVLAGRCLTPLSRKRISVIQLLKFIPHFVIESVQGGIDVAFYTLGFKKDFSSGFFYYQCNLQTQFERTFFNNCVSMLPGTLTVDLNSNWIEIHSINLNNQTVSELVKLEQKVAQLFIAKEQR